MEKFISHTGTAVPLRRSNVDTDQIIPAVYLKRVTRSGFEDGLFAAWRSDPEFVLNKTEYQGGTILVAGVDFGTGSSREHAVWALQNYGFKVVISIQICRYLPRQLTQRRLANSHSCAKRKLKRFGALSKLDPNTRDQRSILKLVK